MSLPPREPQVLERLLRYVALPVLAGIAIGFAALWMMERDGASVPASLPGGTGFAEAVARAAPAVVNVFSQRTPTGLCSYPEFRAFCERMNRNRRAQGSLGSGVMMRPDGHIITNYHVIAAGDDIVVAFNDGSQAAAELVGTDPQTDLAVLKVQGENFPTIERTAAESARIGDIAMAIGNPFGIGQAVSLGIVSAKGRYDVRSPYDDFIQTDAAVNPGNSGGALVDAEGRLLGINTLIYSRSGGSDGVGLAIPVERAVAVLDEIVEHGRVLRGYLGANLSELQDGRRGLQVASVYVGMPAHAAGLLPGDVLLSINGEPADSVSEVIRQIGETAPGSKLAIRFVRNGAVGLVHATAGVRPPDG